MIKKILILLCLLLPLVTSCVKEDYTPPTPANKTVLVYMVASNSLEDYKFDDKDIAEMIEGMQNSKTTGNLIVYVDKKSSTQLLSIEKDENGAYQKKLLKEYEERNSASYSVFSSVLKEVIDRYPANSYGLFMWSHGDGWLPSPSNNANTRWYGQDGSKYMDIAEIKKALKEAPHFDFIYFDDCFMQSVEVAYELRHYADYIMGSPTETPGPGAPYQLLIESVFQDKADVSAMMADYYNYYDYTSNDDSYVKDNWKYGAAISAIKCDELEGLATATKRITDKYAAAIQTVNPSTVQVYDNYNSSYRPRQAYYDFYDLVSQAEGVSAEELSAWKAQLDRAVPYKYSTPTCYSAYVGEFNVNVYSGISVYISRPSYTSWNSFYKTFEWGEASGWSKLVY